jgi:hypothetical protein
VGTLAPIIENPLVIRTRLVRAGMAALAAVNAWWGAWAYVAPRNFFDTFPGFGHHWTAAYPPYNEHLITDLGSTFLTLAALLAAGAVLPDRRVRTVVLGGVLVFNTLHLAFHLGHHQGMAPFDAAASLTSLALGVLAPVVLLVLNARLTPRVTPRRTRSTPDRPS